MNGMVTLAESRQINAEEAAPVPISSYADLKAVLSGYYVCLFTFFEPVPGTDGASVEEVISEFSDPTPHELLWQFYEFWCKLNRMELDIGRLCELPGRAFAMVRWIQVRAVRYVHRQAGSPHFTLQAPKFKDLLEQIMLDAPWMPLSELSHVGYGAHVPGAMQATGPPRGLTGPAPAAAAARERGTPVTNGNPHADYAAFGSVRKTLKEIVATAVRAGQPVPATIHHPNIHYCLSFHVRKTCNSSCVRAADHVRHSAADHDRLKAWCAQNFH
jgi:hypothetical protein